MMLPAGRCSVYKMFSDTDKIWNVQFLYYLSRNKLSMISKNPFNYEDLTSKSTTNQLY